MNQRRMISLVLALFLIAGAVGSAVLAAKTPVAINATSWDLVGVIKGKVQKAGGVKGPITGDLEFGPLGGSGLAANEFRLRMDDSQSVLTVTGTYTVDGRGKVQFNPDLSAFEDVIDGLFGFVIETFFEQAFGSAVDVWWIDVAPMKMKFKAKAGNPRAGCKAKWKGPFTFNADLVDGTTRVIKASYSAKLAGILD